MRCGNSTPSRPDCHLPCVENEVPAVAVMFETAEQGLAVRALAHPVPVDADPQCRRYRQKFTLGISGVFQ